MHSNFLRDWQTCSDCNGTDIVEDWREGDLVCRGCGLVLVERMLHPGPEWRSCNDADNHQAHAEGCRAERVHGDDHSMRTVIADPKLQRIAARVHQGVVVGPPGLKQLRERCIQCDLPPIVTERSTVLYKDYYDTRARTVAQPEVMAACVYLACHIERCSKPIKELCAVMACDASRFHTACNDMMEALATKPYHAGMVRSATAGDLLARAVHRLSGLEAHQRWPVLKLARAIVDRASAVPAFRTQRPSKVNAAVIYVACKALGVAISKATLSKELDVSQATMAKHEAMLHAAC